VDLGLERLAVGVAPGVLRDVLPSMKTGAGFQLSISRGRKPPRSRMRTDRPASAKVWASVPPPAPLPMMMTS
jgi:hypothetical protein